VRALSLRLHDRYITDAWSAWSACCREHSIRIALWNRTTLFSHVSYSGIVTCFFDLESNGVASFASNIPAITPESHETATSFCSNGLSGRAWPMWPRRVARLDFVGSFFALLSSSNVTPVMDIVRCAGDASFVAKVGPIVSLIWAPGRLTSSSV